MREVRVIFSNRKTISLSVTSDVEIIVRAPKRTSKKYIEKFVNSHQEWIENQIARIEEANKNRVVLSDEDIKSLKIQANILLNDRVKHFEKIMNLCANGVKITSAEKRWGSCSGKNSLCFSYKLALLPVELVDYVVVHELAHILEKNHSNKFYAIIEKYMPDYKYRIAKLKELGRVI